MCDLFTVNMCVWIIYSGADFSCTGDLLLLADVKAVTPTYLFTSMGNLRVTHRGTHRIILYPTTSNHETTIDLPAYYVPDLPANLISPQSLVSLGYTIRSDGIILEVAKDSQCLVLSSQIVDNGRQSYFTYQSIPARESPVLLPRSLGESTALRESTNSIKRRRTLLCWHSIFVHASPKSILDVLIRLKYTPNSSHNSFRCANCVEKPVSLKPHPNSWSPCSTLQVTIVSMNISNYSEKTGFVLIQDQFTMYMWLHLIGEEDTASTIMKSFILSLTKRYPHSPINEIRINQDTPDIRDFCSTQGIYTVLTTQPAAELALSVGVKAMLEECKLDISFWPEAYQHAAIVNNLLLRSEDVPFMSPNVENLKLIVRYLYRFGCSGYYYDCIDVQGEPAVYIGNVSFQQIRLLLPIKGIFVDSASSQFIPTHSEVYTFSKIFMKSASTIATPARYDKLNQIAPLWVLEAMTKV